MDFVQIPQTLLQLFGVVLACAVLESLLLDEVLVILTQKLLFIVHLILKRTTILEPLGFQEVLLAEELFVVEGHLLLSFKYFLISDILVQPLIFE